LLAVCPQKLMRIGQRGSVVKQQPNSIRRRGYRQNTIRRSLGGAISDDEDIVVVIDQLVAPGRRLPRALRRDRISV